MTMDENVNERQDRGGHFYKYEKLAVTVGIMALADHLATYGISKDAINLALNNADVHLNTIPLSKWDRAALNASKLTTVPLDTNYPGAELIRMRDREPWSRMPSTSSLGERVCLLKHVARYWVATGKAEEARVAAEESKVAAEKERKKQDAIAARKWHSSSVDRVDEGQDIIDSRDVIAAIEELEEEREAIVGEILTLRTQEVDGNYKNGWTSQADIDRAYENLIDAQRAMDAELAAFDEDDDKGGILVKLKALAEGASGYGDWDDGETLIADHYFEEYAQELAEDIGAINRDASWPNNYIDWEAAARALQQDYTSVEYGDTTYWMRS